VAVLGEHRTVDWCECGMYWRRGHGFVSDATVLKICAGDVAQRRVLCFGVVVLSIREQINSRIETAILVLKVNKFC